MRPDHADTTLRIVDRRVVRLPSVVLVATHLDGSERRATLGMNPLVVGTSTDCELVVHDPGVSRRHCVLTLTARGVIVRDLQSKNGTAVNGTDVLEAFVSPGAVVKIGSTSLCLHLSGPPSDVALWPGATFGDVLGGSIPMRALFARLDASARSSSSILFRGEPGTGKELIARAVHAASSCAGGPFVVFDSANPEALTEASGGTLFIDELLELSPDAQTRLLQATRTGHGDLRLLAATAHDTKPALDGGMLKPELYFRLAGVELRVPPLRERRDDVELLAEHFLARAEPPRRLVDLPPGTLGMLSAHDWPGNVRELKNAVTRLVLFPYAGQAIFADGGVDAGGEPSSGADELFSLPLRDARERVVEHFEAHYLMRKLREHHGNVSRMATAVGLSRQMVHRLLARHGIGSREP
jgi:DNA-binding NtrC family response regulator